MDIAVVGSGAFDGGMHLFIVADVGTNAQRQATRVFDFEIGKVEFRFRAGNESDTGSGGGKSDGEAFANTASGAGDKYGPILKWAQVRFKASTIR
jgi:hypothetical protein